MSTNEIIKAKILELKPSLRTQAKKRLKITEELASELLKNYNLPNFNFGYRYNMYMSGDEGTMGVCTENSILLSFYFIIWAKDIKRVERELLHQICHAIVGIKNSHNQIWIDKAEDIGVYKIDKYKISNRRIINQNRFKQTLSNLSQKQKKRLKQVKEQAMLLMRKHDIGSFKFKFNNDSRFLGMCSHDSISINYNHAINDCESEVRNTILHEIAHAIVGANNGHKKIWQVKARELGVIWKKEYQL